MAEPKRLGLTQISTAKPQKKKEQKRLCHRFTLALVDSTEKTCPEFSFTELMKNASDGKEESDDDDDPFALQDRAEQDKLLAIAKSFEEKYARPQTTKKKKKGAPVQEFVDLGDGYDETDPFIDNAEAYDELVPSCLTTQHGGFYINSGKLDFRAVSDSDDDFQSVPKKKRKKNQITSDPESSEEAPRKSGLKKFKDEHDLKKKKRKKLSSGDHADKPLFKKKKLEKEKLKAFKLKKKPHQTVAELLHNSSTSTPNGVATHHSPVAKKVDGNPEKSLAHMESAIDSVILQAGAGYASEDSENSRSTSPKPSTAPLSSQGLELVPRLPDNLAPNILDLVQKLKKAAKESGEGKCKFFTTQVNNWLLEIEIASCQLKSGSRAIYNHLAAYLPCGKETLIKRAKKLRLDQHDDTLREPVNKIKEAIISLMPSLVEKHQAEVTAVQQQKMYRMQERQEGKDPASTESEEEADKQDGEKQKRLMAPRRKFEWTNETRGFLNSIVRIKMEHYELSKVRSQTPEEYLKNFLEQELKPLWPQGWIQTRMLFKESRAMHNKWTSAGAKPRKPLLMPGAGGKTPTNSTPTSKPSTPVTGSTSISLTTNVVTTPSSSMGTSTVLTSGIPKDYKQISSSSSDSSCYSSGPVSPKVKTLLDYAGDSYTAVAQSKDSKSSVSLKNDLSSTKMKAAAPVEKTPDLKAANSLGFQTADTSKSSQISKLASQTLQNISVAVGKVKSQQTTPTSGKTGPQTVSMSKVSQAAPTVVVPKASKAEESTMSFLEKFYQFAAATTQAVDRVTGAGQKKEASQKVAVQPQAQVPHPSAAKVEQSPAAVSSSQGTVRSSASADPKSQAQNVTLVKPHLAAALQGMYLPASTIAPGVKPPSTAQKTHSYASAAAKTQVSIANLKEASQAKVMPATVHQSQTQKKSSQEQRPVTTKDQGYGHAQAHTQGHKPKSASSLSHNQTQMHKNQQQIARSKLTSATLDKRLNPPDSKGYGMVSPQQAQSGEAHVKVAEVNSSPHSRTVNHQNLSGTTRTHTPSTSHSGQVKMKSAAESLRAELVGATSHPAVISSSRTSPVLQVKNQGQNVPKCEVYTSTQQRATSSHSTKATTFAVPSSKPPNSTSRSTEHERVSSTSGLISPGRINPNSSSHSEHRTKNTSASAFSPTSKVATDRKPTSQSPSSRSPTSAASPVGPHSLSNVKSYSQKATAQSSTSSSSAVSSTTNNEPKFGGLTLSQIQAQTLKASQKAHIQSSPYASQASPTSTGYRSDAPSPSSLYGASVGCTYGSQPAQAPQSIPGYQGLTPPGLGHPSSSPTLHQSPEPGHPGYSLHRSPQAVTAQNNSSLHSIFPSVPASPNSGLPSFGHHYPGSSQSQHRY